jgi:hypothetical protein
MCARVRTENPSAPAETWTVTRRAFGGDQIIPVAYVAGKRWSYAPAAGAFLWLAKSAKRLVAYRPVRF